MIFRYKDGISERDEKERWESVLRTVNFSGNFAWNFMSWSNLCNSFVHAEKKAFNAGRMCSSWIGCEPVLFSSSNHFAKSCVLVGDCCVLQNTTINVSKCRSREMNFNSFIKYVSNWPIYSQRAKIHVCSDLCSLFFFLMKQNARSMSKSGGSFYIQIELTWNWFLIKNLTSIHI